MFKLKVLLGFFIYMAIGIFLTTLATLYKIVDEDDDNQAMVMVALWPVFLFMAIAFIGPHILAIKVKDFITKIQQRRKP